MLDASHVDAIDVLVSYISGSISLGALSPSSPGDIVIIHNRDDVKIPVDEILRIVSTWAIKVNPIFAN